MVVSDPRPAEQSKSRMMRLFCVVAKFPKHTAVAGNNVFTVSTSTLCSLNAGQTGRSMMKRVPFSGALSTANVPLWNWVTMK